MKNAGFVAYFEKEYFWRALVQSPAGNGILLTFIECEAGHSTGKGSWRA
jgi:hypothetical protein